MNFEYGSSLADFQDQKFQDYLNGQSLSRKDKKRLTGNLWVKAAYKTAPNNLIVRHLILIDLYENINHNCTNIRYLLEVLTGCTYVQKNSLYLEGYSYWLYVKPFLVEYNRKFYNIFKDFVETTDFLFSQTAYELKNVLYPAPFGDVRQIPLENQNKLYFQDTAVFPLIKTTTPADIVTYTIKACPIGCNTHIPSKKVTVEVKNGGIFVNNVPFKWYEGYDKKYKNKMEEFADTFSFRRLFSI